MYHSQSPSVSMFRRGNECFGSEPLRTVVWVGGGHDLGTSDRLSASLAQAAALDDADLVVDLSGVTFMDASTIGALVGARNRLRDLSRSLTVRDPSPSAERLLDLCGLVDLIDDNSEPAQLPVATALGSWIDVPVRDRSPDSTRLPEAPEEPSQVPVRSTARRCGATAGSVRQGLALW